MCVKSWMLITRLQQTQLRDLIKLMPIVADDDLAAYIVIDFMRSTDNAERCYINHFDTFDIL